MRGGHKSHMKLLVPHPIPVKISDAKLYFSWFRTLFKHTPISSDLHSIRITAIMNLKMSFTCLVIFLSLLKTGLSYPSPGMQIIISRNKIVDIGENIDLHCSLTKAGNIPLIWLRKHGNNEPTELAIGSRLLIKDDRISLGYTKQNDMVTSSLQFKNIQDTDANIYQCVARSSRLELSSKVELLVKSGPVIDAESTVTVLKKVGEGIEMECHFSGYPLPSIFWSRADNVKLPGNAINRENILTIPQTKREDSGIYYCSAENGVGPIIKHSIDVKLEFLPNVTTPHKKVGRELGTNLDLTCSVDAFPEAENIIWKKDGKTIVADSRHTLSLSLNTLGFNNAVLHIDSLQRDDLGIYTCQATSSLGSGSAQILVY